MRIKMHTHTDIHTHTHRHMHTHTHTHTHTHINTYTEEAFSRLMRVALVNGRVRLIQPSVLLYQ